MKQSFRETYFSDTSLRLLRSPMNNPEKMESPWVVITTKSPDAVSKSWSSGSQLRIGRLPDLEVPIDDVSVSRRHAEVVLSEEGWLVRDLGSSNGTYLNDARLGRSGQRVRQGDLIRVGKVNLRVEELRARPMTVPVGSREMHVEYTARRTWDEAMDAFGSASSCESRDVSTLLRLMRAGYQLSLATSADAAMQRVLDEAVTFFGAQRGGIFLVDNSVNPPGLKSVSSSNGRRPSTRAISKSPASRALSGKESILFQDPWNIPEFAHADSVAHGVMSSIICAVLRSPAETYGILHLDRGPHQARFTEADLRLADSLAAALAVGFERARMIEQQQDLIVQTVTALAQAVELRDPYTGNHTSRVTTYALLLADELGLPGDQRHLLRAAAALHDIGKIAIDDQVLRKPGQLSENELSHMRTHVVRGVEIIQTVPGLSWALPVVRSHHERWDGRGYPDGLKGEQIPLLARIVAVADAFDAMTSDRPYRRGLAASEAFAMIHVGAGSQFDPRCVEAFLKIRPQIETLLDQEKELHHQAKRATDTISVGELRRQMAEDTGTQISQTAFMADLSRTTPVPEGNKSLVET